MLETQIEEMDLETLKERIRLELERMGCRPGSAPFTDLVAFDGMLPSDPPPPSASTDPPSQAPADSSVPFTPSCNGVRTHCQPPSFRDLARREPQSFVREAFASLAGRPPTDTEAAETLQALVSGRTSKAEVFLKLCRSAEGRRRGDRPADLWAAVLSAFLRKLPLFGRLLRTLDGLHGSLDHLRISVCTSLEAKLEALQTRADALEQQFHRGGERDRMVEAHLQEVIHPRINAVEKNLEAFQEETRQALDRLQAMLQPLLFKDVLGHLREHAQAIALVRQALADMQRRLSHPSGREPSQATSLRAEGPSNHAFLNPLYASLEDAFRGADDAIQNRLRFYLPHIQQCSWDLAPVPLVDVGCGRGEWLELLRREGIAAVGVDVNPIMVDRCREKGLEVVLADAVSHLSSLAPGTVGAVTAFHFIEHLDFGDLIRFLDAVYTCLAPGGLLLCETPNPENLMVSTYAFYLDPTHRHPIPPPTARFLLESRGFCNVEILRPPRVGDVPPEAQRLDPLIREMLYSTEDYAVVGTKPPCHASL